MRIAYTAIVLDKRSQAKLLTFVPTGWDASRTCHHVTLTMGPWKGDPQLLGRKVTFSTGTFAANDRVCAFSVDITDNELTAFLTNPPHVTVAVTNGGKPFEAQSLNYAAGVHHVPIELTGVVREMGQGDYNLALVSEELLRSLIDEVIKIQKANG